MTNFLKQVSTANGEIAAFFSSISKDERAALAVREIDSATVMLNDDVRTFSALADKNEKMWGTAHRDSAGLKAAAEKIGRSADASHDLIRQIDHVVRLFSRAVDLAEKELGAKENGHWLGREVRAAGRALEETREAAVERLTSEHYCRRTASHTRQSRKPAKA